MARMFVVWSQGFDERNCRKLASFKLGEKIRFVPEAARLGGRSVCVSGEICKGPVMELK